MHKPIRAVSPRINPRCPQCHCFVRLDAGTCSACGLPFALASESRQGENGQFYRPVEVADIQSGAKRNVQAFSNLQPDGKIKKRRPSEVHPSQLDMFSALEGF